MRGAPPVQMACRPDAPWRWFGLGLHLLALATVAAWGAVQFDAGMPAGHLGAALAVIVTGAMAIVLALVRAPGIAGRRPGERSHGTDPEALVCTLAWDGQCWTLRGHPCEVSVMLDFDRWVLLCVQTPIGHHWVALTLSTTPDGAGSCAKAAFRAALQAHAGPASAVVQEGRVRHADG